MRSLSKSLLLAPLVLSVYSFVFSPEALASTTSNSTNTSTSLSANIQSGDLSLVAPSEGSSFTGIKLNGQVQKVNASLSPWQVIDATGTGNGWSVTVSATQFSEVPPSGGFASGTSALTLPTGSMALVSQGSVTPSKGSEPLSSTGGPLFENVGSVMDGASFEYLKADSSFGMGTYNITPTANDLQLTIDPSSTMVDTVNYSGQPTPYESTITFSLDSAPSSGGSTSTSSTSSTSGHIATPTGYTAITSYAQLQSAVSSDPTGNYILQSNLDLSGTTWVPLGSSSTPFTGTFNANGYTIDGLNLSGSSYSGLFGYTDGATIKNVVINDSTISGSDYDGELIGYAKNTTISGVTSTGFNISGVDYQGGLIGVANGCSISDVYVSGTVSGDGSIGLLAGQEISSSITTTHSAGTVNMYDGNGGGLVGAVDGGTISNTYSTATMSGGGAYEAGLVGSVAGGASISDSYSLNDGLIGFNNTQNVGGTVTNSYYPSGQPSALGTAETTTALHQQSTYSGWNFTSTWNAPTSSSYPTLK